MRAKAFKRDIDLPGWSEQSSWGYDELFECFWARLWRDEDRFDEPRIWISSCHLILTVSALARVMAARIGMDPDEAYLAHLGHSRTAVGVAGPESRDADCDG